MKRTSLGLAALSIGLPVSLLCAGIAAAQQGVTPQVQKIQPTQSVKPAITTSVNLAQQQQRAMATARNRPKLTITPTARVSMASKLSGAAVVPASLGVSTQVSVDKPYNADRSVVLAADDVSVYWVPDGGSFLWVLMIPDTPRPTVTITLKAEANMRYLLACNMSRAPLWNVKYDGTSTPLTPEGTDGMTGIALIPKSATAVTRSLYLTLERPMELPGRFEPEQWYGCEITPMP